MKFIETKVIPIHKSPTFNLPSAYAAAVQRFGEMDAFLLESLAGPDQDCRESIVGINRLASIEIRVDRINIEASPKLLSFLSSAVDAAIGEERMLDRIALIKSSDEVWTILRSLQSLFRLPETRPGFHFGYLTCFSYDAVRFIEDLPKHIPDNDFPLISLALYQSYIAVDENLNARLIINYADVFPAPSMSAIQEILQAANEIAESKNLAHVPSATVTLTMDKEHFLHAANKALHHICMGDIYQVQLGHEIRVHTSMTPFFLYLRLRQLNPSPYMFLCHMGGHDLIGSSPENYIKLVDGQISMRPIAGTIAKDSSSTPLGSAEELASSRKENAEHIMLVDLCRNDIAKICDHNSLHVPTLMVVEEFATLYHLVSTVSGQLETGKDVFDLICATFPAGTMTGAPKIRAMQIIEELEISRRSAYAGAIGLIGMNDYANMALCIRMASRQGNEYRLRACAGIVADSEPEQEWRETLVKMGSVFKALTGVGLTL